MSVLLITYDLNKEKQNRGDYADILAYIKKHAWARLSESSYCIETEVSPHKVYEALEPYLDENDNLAVITLKAPWWAKHSQAVLDWLKARL